MKHMISMRDVSQNEILELISLAGKIENKTVKADLTGKIAALLFYEPSTRTMFSFAAAMKRLGGDTLTMRDISTTSIKKGETFADTLQTIAQYSDLIVLRSPIEGAARYASETVDIPVVNAGDGANQHPTQALLDLYSIVKTQKKLDDLTIAVVGDLRFGRTVHSLVQAMSDFSPRFYFASPSHLKMPQYILDDLRKENIEFDEVKEIDKIVSKLDIMYVTRIQKERFADPEDYEKIKDSYIIDKNLLSNVKSNFKIMHPLPRVNEISTEVDSTPYAYYFQQAKNGVYMRQAIITTLIGARSRKR